MMETVGMCQQAMHDQDCTLQAAMEASSKELHQLQRSLQVQESDLKALKYQLDEKESQVRET